MENSTHVCFETIPVFIVVTPVTQLERAVLAKHPHFFVFQRNDAGLVHYRKK